jgi:hypothetical protein
MRISLGSRIIGSDITLFAAIRPDPPPPFPSPLGPKGEGICGQSRYTITDVETIDLMRDNQTTTYTVTQDLCRGAPGNAGGSGNEYNIGGGGSGHAGQGGDGGSDFGYQGLGGGILPALDSNSKMVIFFGNSFL